MLDLEQLSFYAARTQRAPVTHLKWNLRESRPGSGEGSPADWQPWLLVEEEVEVEGIVW